MVIGSIYRPLVPVSGRAFCYNETEKNKKLQLVHLLNLFFFFFFFFFFCYWC